MEIALVGNRTGQIDSPTSLQGLKKWRITRVKYIVPDGEAKVMDAIHERYRV